MIQGMLTIALTFYGISICISVIRIIIGPSLPDRIVALDMVGVTLVSSIAIISVMLTTTAFLEVILILAILAFISTIAFSKYIERGVILEYRRDD
ncbi:Na(+)/H(+) antiporter subunit F [Oceanobacillus oncorhynchi subsp. incaldanensis]|uniref:Na(+)/H(+) antiporter subunit F n=2 Tax=Oceanobacillus TaxID=182709 RepID=A0A0A1MLB0_9BACI|nr:Na(+)/H(+) antiporter subunit F1 [Oceanobacillus oncorhynchi]MDM8098949.1 Na(+)/H(+) antiporter subunit F1 [Oceanobacillus oncorhynchi]UUI39729.1 Na(+)/H(+) antiporter subunit F1 [Oceanobacillus oncorhynchi]GIO20726.1 Na(+)/H(+) antiporter subunit F [Oceanobacillus oncorhynchi subsp. incaldanensis]CEI80634.1 Na(+)/H(+) antiporter subunit F [Oceanobacillus oncorhynchi]